jgi:hypothetical protein
VAVTVPPSTEPWKTFQEILKNFLKLIQEQVSKDICITTWDQEQAELEKIIKKPKDPPIGNRFNAALQKARNKHNIPNQIFWLEHRATAGLFDKDDAAIYKHPTELDNELRDICKKNIRKKYAENVPFSDVIGNDRKEIRLWKLAISRKQGRGIDSRKMRRLIHTVQQPRAL